MNPNPPLKSQLVEASSYRSISSATPYWYGNLIHVYLELKLDLELEGAEGVQNAKKAQKYIRRAAEAAQVTCEVFNGQVLEIHGRTLHLGLEYSDHRKVEHQMKGASGLLHVLLQRSYLSGGPAGWRMAADHGTTLTIESMGLHEDTSLVSLSPAANFPAKQLGRGEVSLWELGSNLHGEWECEDLEEIAARYKSHEYADQKSLVSASLYERLLEHRAEVFNFSSRAEIRSGLQLIQCQAAPVGEPTDENPYSCYAVVVSMDLDKFTARVGKAALGTLEDKRKLAEDFLEIMKRAEAFAASRSEAFIQFPFAGDNAIFAITAETTKDYEIMKRVTPIEVAVDWEKENGDSARSAGFDGWGQVAAGGPVPHGNTKGNLHIAGIRLSGRRFLIGIGPGMRYAREGFVQVDPSSTQLAMFRKDVTDLHEFLREVFEPCPSRNADVSANYKVAELADLQRALVKLETEKQKAVAALTPAKIQLTSSAVIHRPYLSDF